MDRFRLLLIESKENNMNRIINTIRHPYSTRQALDAVLTHWRADRDLPVAIITGAGLAPRFVESMRVTLSKERKKHPKDAPIHYGFTQSEPFPYTDGGVRGEAVILRHRVTPLQAIRNQMSDYSDLVQQFSFGVK